MAIDLDALGIEEVEPGIVEDTPENRRRLLEAKLAWDQVKDEHGQPLMLIEPREVGVTPERVSERMKPLLVDPKDPWSDYRPLPELALDPDVTGVPHWAWKKLADWEKWQEDFAGRKHKTGGRKEPVLPTRCSTIKKDGNRCWAWAVDKANNGHCRSHSAGAWLKADQGNAIAHARIKLMQSAPDLAEYLLQLAESGTQTDNVKLKAITEALDRAGVRAGVDIAIQGGMTIEVDSAAKIKERLAGLAGKTSAMAAIEDGSIVEGEVIEDDEHQKESDH